MWITKAILNNELESLSEVTWRTLTEGISDAFGDPIKYLPLSSKIKRDYSPWEILSMLIRTRDSWTEKKLWFKVALDMEIKEYRKMVEEIDLTPVLDEIKENGDEVYRILV